TPHLRPRRVRVLSSRMLVGIQRRKNPARWMLAIQMSRNMMCLQTRDCGEAVRVECPGGQPPKGGGYMVRGFCLGISTIRPTCDKRNPPPCGIGAGVHLASRCC